MSISTVTRHDCRDYIDQTRNESDSSYEILKNISKLVYSVSNCILRI